MKLKFNSTYVNKLFKFFSPIVLGLSIIGIVAFIMDESLRIRFIPLIAAYFFPPLGKESVIPVGVAEGIHPVVIALSIAFVDMVVALFLVWNYDLAKKVPFVGSFIERVENIGEKSSSKYSWFKPLRFIGIILFVMVPFQGSGGLVGSILGRLIGMKPWTVFLAISIGSITGCLLIAYFSKKIISIFESNFLQGILVLIVLLIIGVMIYIYRKTLRNNTLNKKDL